MKKIRVRPDEEIKATIIAYRNLYKIDPFLANLMLLCSELSEFTPIPIENEEKLAVFMR